MNFYEKVLIIDPNLEDSAVEETIEKIKDVIIKGGGEIFKTENWGRRKLAYELNKHQKGNYIILHFKSPPATIAKLERFCRVADSILKWMVIRLLKKKQIEAVLPSPAETSAKADLEETKTAQEKVAQAGEGVTHQEDNKNV